MPFWRTPTGLVTGAAVLVGALVIVFVLVRPGSTPSGSAIPIVAPGVTVPTELADGRMLGKATAPVTIDEWTDFQCPFCGMLVRLIEPRLVADFVVPGTARIVAHDFSFLGTGRTPDESTDAAVGARCAANQDRFWQYREYLFSNQHGENSGDYARARLVTIASAVGLDATAFTTCLDDPTIRAAVVSESAQAVSMGITGTPTLFINGQAYTGQLTYDDIAAAIRTAAAGSGAGASAAPSPSPSLTGGSTSP